MSLLVCCCCHSIGFDFSVKVLRPICTKTGHFGDVLSSQSVASTEETKPNTTEPNIHPEQKNTTTQTQKIKPGLVASCDVLSGKGAEPITTYYTPWAIKKEPTYFCL